MLTTVVSLSGHERGEDLVGGARGREERGGALSAGPPGRVHERGEALAAILDGRDHERGEALAAGLAGQERGGSNDDSRTTRGMHR